MSESEQDIALGSVDFSTHILTLASSAMVSLGKLPGPDGKTELPNPETARYLIDILAMLETKTKGNLSEKEQRLLSSIIYDLRMAYVGR